MDLTTERKCLIKEPHFYHTCERKTVKWHLVTSFNPMYALVVAYLIGLGLGYLVGIE